jgi:hypothetical protein
MHCWLHLEREPTQDGEVDSTPYDPVQVLIALMMVGANRMTKNTKAPAMAALDACDAYWGRNLVATSPMTMANTAIGPMMLEPAYSRLLARVGERVRARQHRGRQKHRQ